MIGNLSPWKLLKKFAIAQNLFVIGIRVGKIFWSLFVIGSEIGTHKKYTIGKYIITTRKFIIFLISRILFYCPRILLVPSLFSADICNTIHIIKFWSSMKWKRNGRVSCLVYANSFLAASSSKAGANIKSHYGSLLHGSPDIGFWVKYAFIHHSCKKIWNMNCVHTIYA